jgi:hypothetical protein
MLARRWAISIQSITSVLGAWVHKRTAYPALHHWPVVIKQRVKGS